RPVDLPHPPRAERREDLVGAETSARRKRHGSRRGFYRPPSLGPLEGVRNRSGKRESTSRPRPSRSMRGPDVISDLVYAPNSGNVTPIPKRNTHSYGTSRGSSSNRDAARRLSPRSWAMRSMWSELQSERSTASLPSPA